MKKTTVLFDMDNTLIDRVAAAQSMYRVIVKRALPDGSKEDRQRMFDLMWEIDDNGDTPKALVFGQAAKAFGLSDEWVRVQTEEVWVKEFPLHTVLFEQAETVLRTLQKYYKVGIITNGMSSVQKAKVKAAGLDKIVDMILIGGDVGLRKPDPALYLEGCRRIGCLPEEAYYVGDNIPKDIYGSKAVGMTPVYIWRDDSIPCDLEGVPHIYKIEEVLEVIPCPSK